MGLDLSHECWHGAYSAFSRWRDKLAEVAGYEIGKLETERGLRPTILIDWGHVTDGQVYGDWDETPADPLLVLFVHSDCEGLIRVAQAGPLADRLQELLPLLPDEAGGGHIRHWRGTTQQFIDGLRMAAERGEDVEFG